MRSVIALVFFLFPAMAVAANPPCKMQENAQINVSFNSMESDVATIKPKFDGKIHDIEALAKQAKLDKAEVQSLNYNIYPQNNNGSVGQYQFSGNVSFSVLPADKATDFMILLTKKGYQANLNVNSYRNGACNNTGGVMTEG